ncbi:MAG: TonB-dependent receptor [Saprospiraceae bacterium]
MKKILLLIIIITISISGKSQGKTSANIFGNVITSDSKEYLPFTTLQVKGTTIGTTTDATGHYQIKDLPLGTHILVATYLGYKTMEVKVTMEKGLSQEIKFDLEKDALGLEEVVISADRSEMKRTEAPVIVNTISHKILNTSQAVTLGEGLNFSPGLRLENNCQNCGFSQVRMNGMEGPYSQILINSRPIFSGLAGVYGLELIPANIIDRIEVVRGGGSALYGSNAIAGTINIIMKEPTTNSYEAGTSYAITGLGTDGNEASDFSANLNASLISSDMKTGMSVYGFKRDRAMYDANNDGFSEIAPLENLSFGGRVFHKFGYRDKLSLDFIGIKEQRDGGSDQNYPVHQRRIAEVVTHDLSVAALTYERYLRKYDMLSAFASGQFLNRDSYYGAEYSMSDYGNTKDKTFNIGLQYKAIFNASSLIIGVDNTSGFLMDKKIGSPIFSVDDEDNVKIIGNNPNTIVSDQSSITSGVFAQYDFRYNSFKASLGGRYDTYEINNNEKEGERKYGSVFIPRISLMYGVIDELQFRATYSQGYRAPQIFDEDLHIETSGLRQVIHENSKDLKQETSHSVMLSLDYNKLIGTVYSGLLIEGFYTKLVDAFANELGDPDENDVVTYTRINSSEPQLRVSI